MSIDLRVADAVNVEDVILVPWPDWFWRPVVVLAKLRHKGLVIFQVRPREGADMAITKDLARAATEPMQVVVKITAGGHCKRCGKALPDSIGRAGPPAQYCSRTCTTLAHRAAKKATS